MRQCTASQGTLSCMCSASSPKLTPVNGFCSKYGSGAKPVRHAVCQPLAVFFNLDMLFGEGPLAEGHKRKRFESRKLSAPVTPIPADIGAGISAASLRKQLESPEHSTVFSETHEYVTGLGVSRGVADGDGFEDYPL
jgi:hypothetical protein